MDGSRSKRVFFEFTAGSRDERSRGCLVITRARRRLLQRCRRWRLVASRHLLLVHPHPQSESTHSTTVARVHGLLAPASPHRRARQHMARPQRETLLAATQTCNTQQHERTRKGTIMCSRARPGAPPGGPNRGVFNVMPRNSWALMRSHSHTVPPCRRRQQAPPSPSQKPRKRPHFPAASKRGGQPNVEGAAQGRRCSSRRVAPPRSTSSPPFRE